MQGAGSNHGQFGVQCLAQEHFDMLTGSNQDRPTNPVISGLCLLSHSICSLHYTLNTHPERKSHLTLNHRDTISCHVYISNQNSKTTVSCRGQSQPAGSHRTDGKQFFYYYWKAKASCWLWNKMRLEIKRFWTDDRWSKITCNWWRYEPVEVCNWFIPWRQIIFLWLSAVQNQN